MEKVYMMTSILNDIQKGKTPLHNNYDISPEMWWEIAEEIKVNGYAKHIELKGRANNNISLSPYTYSTLSISGILYMVENKEKKRTF